MLPVDVVIIFEGVQYITLFDKLCFADRVGRGHGKKLVRLGLKTAAVLRLL